MLNNFTLIMALRYFSAKKNEKFVSVISFISLVGITIGVAALIIVMSIMNGFHTKLTSNMIGLNGDIKITSMAGRIDNHTDILEGLNKKPYIKNTVPMVVGQALALGARANGGAIIKGIDLKHLKNKGEIMKNIFGGSFADYHGHDAVAVGSELALSLGLYPGTKVKLISPNLLSTAFGSMPRSKTFRVVAIFNSGMYDYDAATMLMPLEAAQTFLDVKGSINLIELHIDKPEKADEYSFQIENEYQDKLLAKSWLQENKQFLGALQVERTAMFMILSLIIMVAAFNIIASLFMLVKDKTKDIAILKTIGASNRQITCAFMLSGMIIGVIGTFFGVLLGLLFSYNIENIRKMLEKISGTTLFDPAIYFFYSLPSEVDINDVIWVASMALLMSFLATIYPSRRAAKLNPVEAMRYE